MHAKPYNHRQLHSEAIQLRLRLDRLLKDRYCHPDDKKRIYRINDKLSKRINRRTQALNAAVILQSLSEWD